MPSERGQGVRERNEIARHQPRPLVNQLVKGVLPVGAGFAPINRPGLVLHLLAASVTCLPLLSMVNCWR